MVKLTYNLVQKIFEEDKDSEDLRQKCLQNGMINTFIERIGLLTCEIARVKTQDKDSELDNEETIMTETKKKKRDKNRKGVGYTTDVGQEWNVNSYLKKKESKHSQIANIIGILKGIIMSKELSIKFKLKDLILESALLPVLENAFRSGSILEMSKDIELFTAYLDFAATICSNSELTVLLMEIDKEYEPVQTEPIYKLLEKLAGLADIFLKALSTEKDDIKAHEDSIKPKKLAEKIKEVNSTVQQTVSSALKSVEEPISDILKLSLAEKYRKLISPLRFGYMDMRSSPSSSSYTHYYSYNIAQETSIENAKIVRLAQEMADLSNALPNEHTNAIFVRVDETRVDVMKAIICGASSTPYAHGCFEYDIFFDSRYPNTPPKCQLVTTGSGAVRFNPNLYADGKVCLSLLGTWRGNSTENWDAKISTVLQVLMSIQAIIMSEEVYYNEPGYEHEAGTTEGEAKNEAYSNIVRYCNIQYAMIDQMLNPSKGFEDAIRKHFFLKRDEILEEVKEWLVYADENKASYSSLVECHNHSWCQKFKEDGKYKSMLKEIIDKLTQTFKGLSLPTLEHELKPAEESAQTSKSAGEAKSVFVSQNEESKASKEKSVKNTEEDIKMLEEVDMKDDEEVKTNMEINVESDEVKDRWSRYIGAMGIDAVSKQANARVFLYGLGGLGAEIAKNMILAGLKELTLCDSSVATHRDLSSNFFLSESDIGKNRATSCSMKIQQLNYYVKVSLSDENLQTTESIEKCNLANYDVVILTETPLDTQKLVDDYCRLNGVKFITADVNGVFSRVFNDFGDQFEVIDKDGEEIKELIIKSISSESQGLVTLQEGFRHPFQDGDEVMIEKVEGMEIQNDDGVQTSINRTIHKVTTVSPSSFRIGDTSQYSEYKHSGLARPVKSKLKLAFQSLRDIKLSEVPIDDNLSIADFEKIDHPRWGHLCYEIIDEVKKLGKYFTAKTWRTDSFEEFGEIFESKLKEYLPEDQAKELLKNLKFEKFVSKYCVVNSGTFNPLCAFIGGVVSQETIKAITQKFVPIKQFMYYDAIEIVPDFRFDTKTNFEEDMKTLGFMTEIEDRYTGLRTCIGSKLLDKIQEASIFMVGAGAIGCELLKNYALLGAGSKKEGSIILTDPDVIEVSNLNRQFLFREKHLRKPKSVTAAAAAIHMNPEMKGRIVAKLDKIHKGTEDVYSLQFYKSLSVITNALDNIQARRFLDGQCVRARIPMIDSGTLGPKGHVQVVLPDKTETYSSTNDPEDTTEIPHCTLKMFPEEALHCVEWAKDLFMQLYSQSAKSYNKVIEDEEIFNPNDSDQKKIVKEALSLIEDRPTDFKSCIRWARLKFNQYFVLDILQLLHAYPLDHKTKDGKPFWSLPKRAPEMLKFDPENELHARFIASAACLRARVFNIEIPFKAPREKESIMKMGRQATEYNDELPEFKPDKSKADQIKAEVDEEQDKKEGTQTTEEEEEEHISFGEDFDEIKEFIISLRKVFNDKKDKPEESKLLLTNAQEFEKDDDTNFHIDFIYSCANCRASNYVLDQMDWITTKLKAGRIIPALSTTTSAIAGLQTLEMIKILNDSKLEEIRNANLNLAVPSLMVSEPGPPKKVTLKAGLDVSVWDIWTLQFSMDATLRDLINAIDKKYELEAKDIFKDGHPVYLHVLDSVQQLDKRDKTLQEVFKVSPSQTEVEIMVTFSDPNNNEKILEGVPPIVIKFK